MGIPIISLFSGCGGFDIGFESSGFDVELALDIDPVAVRTYNNNRGCKVAKQADLNETTALEIIGWIEDGGLPAPRGIIGGSPCQTFSYSNVHMNVEDVRHTLPRKYASILNVLNQKYNLDFFVFENVLGITSKKHNETFSEFKGLFQQAGFCLFEKLLDAVDFDVAQDRPRVFVIGINNKKYPTSIFSFPVGPTKEPVTVAHKLAGLPTPVFFNRNLTPEAIQAATGHPNHWTMQPKSPKFHNGYLKEGDNQGRSFRVLSWEKPSWTVAYGHREIHIHPNGTRRLSIYEALLLQGFEDNYHLSGTLSDQVRQISDAIPPPVGRALGKAIFQFLIHNTSGYTSNHVVRT